jgi:hypothetical protein
MKPSKHDRRHRVRISGDELVELKRHTGAMAEAFGLDRKIDSYKGTRPLTLYRWDLECLLDVIVFALRTRGPTRTDPPPATWPSGASASGCGPSTTPPTETSRC